MHSVKKTISAGNEKKQDDSGCESHINCLLCGTGNLLGLKLKFSMNQHGEVSAVLQGHSNLQGYCGIMHGGVISALLDSVMTNCLFKHGIEAMTADLHIRYLKPVPCQDRVGIRARIVYQRPPLFRLESELFIENQIMARAKAQFIQKHKRCKVIL
jgi:uncharacterized protein (TIGR00369 family)